MSEFEKRALTYAFLDLWPTNVMLYTFLLRFIEPEINKYSAIKNKTIIKYTGLEHHK